jgi:hypothetical protein
VAAWPFVPQVTGPWIATSGEGEGHRKHRVSCHGESVEVPVTFVGPGMAYARRES